MDAWIVFNLIVGIANIASAIFSYMQAKESKKSANRAQEIKDQLIANKKTADISELLSAHRKALRSMEKFGPGYTHSTLKGITPLNETQDVRDFYALLKQNRKLFGQRSPNKADNYCNNLITLLDAFAQSQSDSDMFKYGKDLYIILVDLSPLIKAIMDKKLEETF